MDRDQATDIDHDDADHAVAEQLLAKVRSFVRDQLTAEERAMFAVLLAPGVAEASGASAGDVTGFGVGDAHWEPAPLPDHLARAVRDSHIQIVTD